MAVILLPLHLPATHWRPQRMTYAPIPKTITPSAGDEPRPEIDYWEFEDGVDRALRVQFRVPDGYQATPDPVFNFHWFTPQTNITLAPVVNMGQIGAREIQAVNLAIAGFGVSTPITGMYPDDDANIVLEESVTLDTTPGIWVAGAFATLVFYRNGASGGDLLAEVLNFLGGDLIIAVTKEMG